MSVLMGFSLPATNVSSQTFGISRGELIQTRLPAGRRATPSPESPGELNPTMLLWESLRHVEKFHAAVAQEESDRQACGGIKEPAIDGARSQASEFPR